MNFFKAIFATLVFASLSASAATFDCLGLSKSVGGRVQLISHGGNQSGLSFQLIKNNMIIGRLDFAAVPTKVMRQNLKGQEVPFLRFFDSITSPTVVVTTVLLVEDSLLNGGASEGLVTFQQQSLEQYLCRPATN